VPEIALRRQRLPFTALSSDAAAAIAARSSSARPANNGISASLDASMRGTYKPFSLTLVNDRQTIGANPVV
jgi:hypothetical protein